MSNRVMYGVYVRDYGRPIVRRGPAEGLPDWPRSRWTRITPRPVGLARARALADAQEFHAAVNVWETSEKVYDNDKPPRVPPDWIPAEANLVPEGWRPGCVARYTGGGFEDACKLPADGHQTHVGHHGNRWE